MNEPMNPQEQLAHFLSSIGLSGGPATVLQQFQSIEHLAEQTYAGNLTTFKGIGPQTEEAVIKGLKDLGLWRIEPAGAPDQAKSETGPIDFQALSGFFYTKDISWKPVAISKKTGKGLAAAYLTNRAIMDRLDLVCGPERWVNSFEPGPGGGILCGIGIEVQPNKWVWKYDGAENTDIEPVKGGLSTSMRRAAVQWGIGRYLYNIPSVWVAIDQQGRLAQTPTIPPEFLPRTQPAEQRFAFDPDAEYYGITEGPGEAPEKPVNGRREQAPTQPQPQPQRSAPEPARGSTGPVPIGQVLAAIMGKYNEGTNWGNCVPDTEKRKPFGKATKRDYDRLIKHREKYGWTPQAFALLLNRVFSVAKVSAMNLSQYWAAYHLVTKEAAFKEFEEMAYALERERQEVKASAPNAEPTYADI